MPKIRPFCFLIFTLALGLSEVCTSPSRAGLIASSIVDNNGEWTLGPTHNQFFGPVAGLSPTAGSQLMHFNNVFSITTGTNFIVFESVFLQAGTYEASINVGSFTNRPLATIGNIGMTTGGSQPSSPGSLLTPTSALTPLPSQGTYRTWKFTYDIKSDNPNLGSAIGFSISVPFTGQDRNVAFDNLRINFTPVPEPSSIIMIALGMLGLAGYGRWRTRQTVPVGGKSIHP